MLLGQPAPPVENLSYWVDYVEQTAGIEAIASYLDLAEGDERSRFLDVGCGYGFGLDLARTTRGWDAIGIDPSVGGRLGASELGVEIRNGRLESSVAPGERFDIVLASEVLEHVADPRSLLGVIRTVVNDDGLVIVTTPNADIVHPDRSDPEVLMALAIGDHQFLVGPERFEVLLRDAGFDAVEVDAGANTLIAAAAPTSAGLRRSKLSSGHSPVRVDEYLEQRAISAAQGSSLAVGMWARLLQSRVFAGALAEADEVVPRLRDAIDRRYGIDIHDPQAINSVGEPPAVLTGVFFLRGFLAFVREQDPLRAAEFFRASLAVSDTYESTHVGQPVPQVPLFEVQALGHLALCLAPSDQGGALHALARLDGLVASGTCDPEVARDFRERALAAASPPRASLRARSVAAARRALS